MKILDCETADSTYKSLETITGVSSKEIKDFLTNLYIKEDIYVEDKIDFILEEFKSKYNPSLEYDLTYWFHLTRTFNLDEFKEGLLPLNEIIDKIWDSLFTVTNGKVTMDEWTDYRHNLENGKLGVAITSNQGLQYNMKTKDKVHWGPYGFLIADQVLKDNYTSDHYFNHPEIITHICYPFEKLHNYDLLDMYQKNTKPCIVKFQSNDTDLKYIGDALHYLYNIVHDRKRDLYST